MKQAITLFICFSFIFSCKKEEEASISAPNKNTSFSKEEMEIISKTLNLDSILYNYSNPTLPKHYLDEGATEADNTPEHNNVTDAGATLGRVLFYDKNLSANNTISCASCHEQEAAFSDNRKFSVGLNGGLTKRNSMGLLNAKYYENEAFFWDERAVNLEEQVLLPIQDHIEMGMTLQEVNEKLSGLDYYEVLFKKAFGDKEINSKRISLAMSQFIRSIIPTKSKFDKGLAMVWPVKNEEEIPDLPNFTEEENIGLDIFYRGRKGATCLYCHGTAQNVNDEAKNNGLSLNYLDNGKGKITNLNSDMALFKVPSLRNIENTAPYMHDGRFETLMEVVNHYSDSVQDHPNLHFRLKTLDDGVVGDAEVLRLNLNQQEKEALVAFLKTLTDEEILVDPKFSNPFKN